MPLNGRGDDRQRGPRASACGSGPTSAQLESTSTPSTSLPAPVVEEVTIWGAAEPSSRHSPRGAPLQWRRTQQVQGRCAGTMSIGHADLCTEANHYEVAPAKAQRSSPIFDSHDAGGYFHKHDARCAEMTLVPLPRSVSFRERPDARRQATWTPSGWSPLGRSLRVAVQGRHSTLTSPTRPATHHAQVAPEGQSPAGMSQLSQAECVAIVFSNIIHCLTTSNTR